MTDVTKILDAIDRGDPSAADRLLPLVYDELRRLAAVKMAHEKPGQTLQATALVHEAYMRLVDGQDGRQWDSRAHFFAAAAEAMRRILVDSARRRQATRRGGDRQHVPLDDVRIELPGKPEELIDLDDALNRLEELDSKKARLVKLRYFAGLTIPETAAVLGISTTTADRYWSYARAWLHQEIINGGDREAGG